MISSSRAGTEKSVLQGFSFRSHVYQFPGCVRADARKQNIEDKIMAV